MNNLLSKQFLHSFFISLETIAVVGCMECAFSLTCLFLLSRCPYYISREIHKVVDILFAPYNYLIDRGYRKSLNLDWKNSVLIFDEAHNLVRGKSYAFDMKILFVWKAPKLLSILFFHFETIKPECLT